MSQDAIEAATAATSAASAGSIASAASKVTLTGGAALVGGWLVSNEFAAVIDLLVDVVSLAVQWYYRHREFGLRKLEHEAWMLHGGAAVRDTLS